MSPSILDICNFVRDFMDLTLQLETLFREEDPRDASGWGRKVLLKRVLPFLRRIGNRPGLRKSEILQEELFKTVQSIHNSDKEIVRTLSDGGFVSINLLEQFDV